MKLKIVYALKKSYIVLKLYKDDWNNLQRSLRLNTITLVAIKYTLFDSSHFIHSACGSSTVKTYAHKHRRTLLDEQLFCNVIESDKRIVILNDG